MINYSKFIEKPKCILCKNSFVNDEIWRKYISKNKNIGNNSCWITQKKIGNDYFNRIMCDNCFEKKHNRKPKKINTLSYDLIDLMNVPESLIISENNNRAVTEENMIKKYGEELGKEKFKNYCNQQSITNTFDYKEEKYSMSIEEFENFNKSRSVTLENMIKKYGVTEGTSKWESYCNRQRYTTTKEYFVEKYGEVIGLEKYNESNKLKGITLENMIKKYGENIGTEKYNAYLNNQKKLYSKVSFELFERIHNQLKIDFKGYSFLDNIYYGESEYCINTKDFTGYFDFVITSNINLCIEFYGNDIHANPKKYKSDDMIMSWWYDNLKAEDVWLRDEIKNNIIKDRGFNLIIVWEDKNIFENIYSQVLSHIYNTLGYTLEDFIVEDLGIKEEWVYDIEVEDNHNFFANNILVHNSAYLMYNLPFDKFEDINQLVSYIQGLARELGNLYNESLNYYGQFANLDPEYNTMDFKSEVVAYRGFFGAKKFYALAKCWDEGTFFNEKPKVKKTGGQIVKADVTPLTKAMLEEIYDVLITDFKSTDLGIIYQKIFIVIKNKYMMMIKKELNSFNIDEFSSPKKWGKTEKSVPPQVTGAKLYNAIIRDTFRPSDSFIMIKIVIDPYKLLEFLKVNVGNEFALSYADADRLRKKINVISVPVNMSDEEKQLLSNRLRELSIQLDFQDIINFNINMKLDPYVKLFPENIRNMYS